MKLTKSKLMQIIKEELSEIQYEHGKWYARWHDNEIIGPYDTEDELIHDTHGLEGVEDYGIGPPENWSN